MISLRINQQCRFVFTESQYISSFPSLRLQLMEVKPGSSGIRPQYVSAGRWGYIRQPYNKKCTNIYRPLMLRIQYLCHYTYHNSSAEYNCNVYDSPHAPRTEDHFIGSRRGATFKSTEITLTKTQIGWLSGKGGLIPWKRSDSMRPVPLELRYPGAIYIVTYSSWTSLVCISIISGFLQHLHPWLPFKQS